MLYEKEKQVALEASRQAARLCQQVRNLQGSLALSKIDRSPVTIADFGAQAVICQALKTAFPQDPIVAEEDATMLQQPESAEALDAVTQQVQQIIPHSTPLDIMEWIDRGNGQIAQRYWTLDPIDGTKGFIRGDQYAIALALVEAGEVKLGIVTCPALPYDYTQPTTEKGVIFVAVRGHGTAMMSLEGKQSQLLWVNQVEDASQWRLIESVESSHSDRSAHRTIAQAIGITHNPLTMDSQAKYGAVARGEADLNLRVNLPQFRGQKENIWDHAAGAIVVTEAGGTVTDLDGKPFDFSGGAKMNNNRGVLASNAVIHKRVLEAIRKHEI